MKLSILLSLLLLITVQSTAQENPDKLLYFGKAEKYRKMRNAGTTLTILGSVLTVVGGITMSNSVYNAAYGSESDDFALGSVAFLIGVGSLGSGIPLWIVGAHNHQKYNSKLESLSVRFNANPQSKGLTLTYRF